MTSLPVLKLSPEETAIIAMIRRNTFQDISIQIKDSVIVSVNQILKYQRKKGGGLVAGHLSKPVNINMLILTPEEISVIGKIREKPYQQINIQIKNSIVECVEQTVKFRNKNKNTASKDGQ